MPRKATPAAEPMTIDMLDTSSAETTQALKSIDVLTLEPVVQHNAPALQGSTEIAVAPLTGPMGAALQWMKQGASLADLRELLALQKEHEAHEAEKAFNAAFAAFKAEAIVIIKSITVLDGPLIGKKYEDLFAVVDAVTPSLSKHGLAVSWKTTRDDAEWIEVTCTLRHVLGHRETVSMGNPPDKGGAKVGIHARASTVTYLQRYTTKAILGIAAKGEDTDGNVPKETPTIDAQLLMAAQTAAMEGWKALAAFISKLTPAQVAELNPESDKLKACAKKVDADARAAGKAVAK